MADTILLAIGLLLLISLLHPQHAHSQRPRIVSAPPVTDAINEDPFAEIMRPRRPGQDFHDRAAERAILP